jgi:plastocyanin
LIHSTGVIAASETGPGSATLSFPKAGTYKLFCLIHPGMEQTVTVKAKPKKKKKLQIDTKTTVRTRIARESTAAWARAHAAANTPVPANTVFAGVGRGQTTLLAFLPATLTVPVGTTVNFTNMSLTELHNEGFGPPDWIQSFMTQTDFFPFPTGGVNQASPLFFYGSDPPGCLRSQRLQPRQWLPRAGSDRRSDQRVTADQQDHVYEAGHLPLLLPASRTRHVG